MIIYANEHVNIVYSTPLESILIYYLYTWRHLQSIVYFKDKFNSIAKIETLMFFWYYTPRATKLPPK